MTRRLAWRAVLTIAFALMASRASAAPSCTISVTSVAFGNYDVFNASSISSTGTVTYRCNGAASNVTITLDQGQAGSFSPRTMKKGSESLPYNLYLNAGLTSVWGDGTSGTQVYSSANPPNNTNINVTIFGNVPAGADVSAGAYADTVAATINF